MTPTARRGNVDVEPQKTRGAASDGLTAAERRLLEVIGPNLARYEAALARIQKEKAPPDEIGFGEPDA